MSDSPSADGFYRRLCECAGVGMLATDEECRIRFCNQMAADLFGLQPADLIGRPLAELVPPEHRDLAHRHLAKALAGEVCRFDFRQPAGDHKAHVSMTVSPIDCATASAGVSVVLADVTRQMHMARKMARLQKMAALESMAGAVAHHFNNLIGGVLTTLDFAKSSGDTIIMARALNNTLPALERLRTMTQRLLAFAEGDHGDNNLTPLGRIVREHVDRLTDELSRRGIELHASIQPIQDPVPDRPMQAVLEALTTNAIEAMPDGGRLSVILEAAGPDKRRLAIADTGLGVRPEHVQRLFEPFFTTKQSDRDRTDRHPGLGLAVVHGIVSDLGGTAEVHVAPEAGIEVEILLPVSPETSDKTTMG